MLPLNASSAAGIILGGAISNMIGFLNPVMLLGGALTSAAAGLLSSISISATDSLIMGLSALAGVGAMASQQPVVATNVFLSKELLPTGISVMLFSTMVGSAIGVAIAQAAFFATLDINLRSVPGVDASTIFDTGATALRDMVQEDLLPLVLRLYNSSMTIVFYISVGGGCVMVLTGLFVKWEKADFSDDKNDDSSDNKNDDSSDNEKDVEKKANFGDSDSHTRSKRDMPV